MLGCAELWRQRQNVYRGGWRRTVRGRGLPGIGWLFVIRSAFCSESCSAETRLLVFDLSSCSRESCAPKRRFRRSGWSAVRSSGSPSTSRERRQTEETWAPHCLGHRQGSETLPALEPSSCVGWLRWKINTEILNTIQMSTVR